MMSQGPSSPGSLEAAGVRRARWEACQINNLVHTFVAHLMCHQPRLGARGRLGLGGSRGGDLRDAGLSEARGVP